MRLKPLIIRCNRPLDLISKLNGFRVEGFEGLFPFILVRPEVSREDINHVLIHFHQQVETLVVGFWLLYAIFYFMNRNKPNMTHESAYRAIPFEAEAYAHDHEDNYIDSRSRFAWLDYLSDPHDEPLIP